MKLQFDLWFVRDQWPIKRTNYALCVSALVCAVTGGGYFKQAGQLSQVREALWRQQQIIRAEQQALMNKPVVTNAAQAKAIATAQQAIHYDWNLAFDALEQAWPIDWIVLSFEHNAATDISTAVIETALQSSAGELKLSFPAPWEVMSIENRIEAGIAKTQVRLRAKILK
jgi:hypothetical protein